MYEFVQGKLIEKSPMRAVLDVHGVGYEVRIPISTFSKLPALGEAVRLLTHFIVREDAQQLYGFFTPEEREFFRLLISISGIGPKMGITMLSGMTLPELRQAIIQGSILTLTNIPGIGKKTAERVIVELREKVVSLDVKDASPMMPSGPASAQDQILEDSIQALQELGYKKQDAKDALQKAWKELEGSASQGSVPELIRKSLKYV
ncbi:MAG: Holliday junction branch migration protein RuvA [Candidatus Omnitrophica bacterium]|nr:Holliday junction branch migration protein RuvA [Candidatus Omnitrophota bacterium]